MLLLFYVNEMNMFVSLGSNCIKYKLSMNLNYIIDDAR